MSKIIVIIKGLKSSTTNCIVPLNIFSAINFTYACEKSRMYIGHVSRQCGMDPCPASLVHALSHGWCQRQRRGVPVTDRKREQQKQCAVTGLQHGSDSRFQMY